MCGSVLPRPLQITPRKRIPMSTKRNATLATAATVAALALGGLAIAVPSLDDVSSTTLIAPADSHVATTLPATPTSTTSKAAALSSTTAATTTATTSATAATAATGTKQASSSERAPEGASVPDGDLKALANSVDEVLSEGTTEQDLDNMPAPAPAPARTSKTDVSRLTTAPLDHHGEAQRWFSYIRSMPGGEAVAVRSASMGRDIPVAVIRAHDASGAPVADAPTYYLLNGAGGSEQNSDWLVQAWDEIKALSNAAPVNIVIPMEGAFSYYVDWLTVPEKNVYYHGPQMWSTFLGEELPYAIEDYLDAGERRAVSGFSMSATSSLLLAEHFPGRYDAVGSFSGCAATSTALPSFFVGLTVNRGSAGKGGVFPEHLWGPRGSDYNRFNDALVMAEKLQGTNTQLYVSSGTGLPAETDMIGYLKEIRKMTSSQAFAQSAVLHVEGGAIEGAMNACSHDLNAKLRSLGVPVTFNQRPVGTHSWPLWRDDLKVSWEQVIGPALGY